MKSKIIRDIIFDAIMEKLSVEDLETMIAIKKQESNLKLKPMELNPIAEEEKLKEYYRKLILEREILYPPKLKNR
ncbi:hypothetical protein GTQ40_05380 [Flavobacteriaceae bacterium R38]|nr:hypothetical protein [Flavobacteriaceae bacterium R38]